MATSSAIGIFDVGADDADISLLTPQQLSTRRRQVDQVRFNQNARNMSGLELAASETGDALGKAIVNVATRAGGGKDPEMQHAEDLQAGIQEVDNSFAPDPDKSEYANEAERISQYTKRVGYLLDPKQRAGLTAKRLALVSDDINQSRLKAQDTRAEARSAETREKAVLDNQIAQLDLEHAGKVAQFGDQANLGVFGLPDSSTSRHGMGSDEYFSLMERANDPESGVTFKGFWKDIVAERLAMGKAKAAAAGKAKPYKVTDAKAKAYSGLQQIGQALAYFDTDEGAVALERFGSPKAYLDAAQEWASAKTFGLIPGETESLKAATQIQNLSIAQQQLIQGVPSNHDQYLIELTKPDRLTTSPEVARSRIEFLREDAVNRVRAAYADFKNNAMEDQPAPAALVQALTTFGIDPSTVGNADEEQQRLDAMEKRAEALSSIYTKLRTEQGLPLGVESTRTSSSGVGAGSRAKQSGGTITISPGRR